MQSLQIVVGLGGRNQDCHKEGAINFMDCLIKWAESVGIPHLDPWYIIVLLHLVMNDLNVAQTKNFVLYT